MSKIPRILRKGYNFIKRSGGFLTAKGKILDYDEVHSFGLGFMSGLHDEPLQDSWKRDRSRVDGLEWHYYRKAHEVGEVLPESWTIYGAGWILGFVKASILWYFIL